MLPDQLREQLDALGYRYGKAFKDTGIGWYAWISLEGATDCACNEKPPVLVINPYCLETSERKFYSVEFDVTGEVRGGQWVKLQAYSVPMDECVQAIPRVRAILLAAWNAAAMEQITNAA